MKDNLNTFLWLVMVQVLPNKGSTARDHLANERTFLAWLRTALSLVGAGIALIKFKVQEAGYLFSVLGLIFLIVSTHRYFITMRYSTNKLPRSTPFYSPLPARTL